MILRYSATHKTEHNKVHRLDALDAYNQKLVKKIAVRGIAVKGLAGTNAYLYLQSIAISPTSRRWPCRVRAEAGRAGIKRMQRSSRQGRQPASPVGNGLEQYRGIRRFRDQRQ